MRVFQGDAPRRLSENNFISPSFLRDIFSLIQTLVLKGFPFSAFSPFEQFPSLSSGIHYFWWEVPCHLYWCCPVHSMSFFSRSQTTSQVFFHLRFSLLWLCSAVAHFMFLLLRVRWPLWITESVSYQICTLQSLVSPHSHCLLLLELQLCEYEIIWCCPTDPCSLCWFFFYLLFSLEFFRLNDFYWFFFRFADSSFFFFCF